MPQIINTNIASLTAQNNLNTSQMSLQTAIQRLSSGLRINSAADDAAGLAISQRMLAQLNGLNQAARNAQDGISLSQTADGALSAIGNNLQRIRELAVQSANSTNSASDRAALQQEVSQLTSEIDRVATQTQFNGLNLLDGSFTAQQFQVGANSGQTIAISSLASARSSALGTFQGFTLTNKSIGTASQTAAAQTLVVGGSSYSLGTIANDAKAIAAAANSAGIQGLSVSANATSVAAATQTVTGTGSTDTFVMNGISISVTGTATASTNRTNLVTALNAQSAVTGVVATDTGSGVSLAAADGRNISYTFTAGTGGGTIADYGVQAAGTFGGTVNMTYSAPSGVSGSMTSTGAFSVNQAIAATGTAISAVDISTVSGANSALTAVDAALQAVNGERAQLGAIQNRFQSTVSNLQTSAQNLTASKSRITDTDFAAETSNLTRAQILQQAGTAMLAQANALPNSVLTLLKG